MSGELLQAVRQRVWERAIEHQLPTLAGLISQNAELRVVLRECSDSDEEVGRIGGKPRLPEGMPWPVGETGPLVAWLEVELQRLPASSPLPSSGRLLFFLVPERRPHPCGDRFEADAGRVIFVPPQVEVVEAEPPEGVTMLPARRLRAVLETSIPSQESVFVRDELERLCELEESLWEREHELEEDELPPEQEVTDRYHALMEALRYSPSREDATGPGGGGACVAELGGHTSPCQDDPLMDRAVSSLESPPSYPLDEEMLGALEEAARDWRLLAQAPANPPLGYDFLSGGWLYFLIPAGDLAAGDFDGVQTIAQR